MRNSHGRSGFGHRAALLRERLGYLRHVTTRDWYAVRRGAIAPEALYKRRLLRRIQRHYRATYLVETGTFLGGTPAFLRHDFDQIYTIELSPELHARACANVQAFPNIHALLGDSAELLPEVVERLDAPAMFWLDGHFSSGGTAGTASSNPILGELSAIASSPSGPHIVLIDDMSDFSATDYGCSLSEVVRAVEEIKGSHRIYFDYDVLLALPDDGSGIDFWRDLAPAYVVR